MIFSALQGRLCARLPPKAKDRGYNPEQQSRDAASILGIDAGEAETLLCEKIIVQQDYDKAKSELQRFPRISYR